MYRAAYILALSRLEGVGAITMRRLFEALPSIEDTFHHPAQLRELFPAFYARYQQQLASQQLLEEAQRDVETAVNKGIDIITMDSEEYPPLLRECVDAPLLLFYKGNKQALASEHKLSIVGTRNATHYGRNAIEKIIGELSALIPDLTIISGLAYGIDIAAHRAALTNNIATIGVLAHGLDRVYPYQHRSDAVSMLERGGLLTEYPLGTSIERFQFVGRNRIVAGLTSATLVIESALHGGALLTAAMASDYHRDVLALPGRITDRYSEGCNKLIQQQLAIPITNAKDIVEVLQWETASAQASSTASPSLFPDLDMPEEPILRLLMEEEAMHFNDILSRLHLSSAELANKLFELEMDNHVIALPGGKYSLA